MRHGLAGTLLLSVGLAVVPATSIAAEPSPQAFAPGEMGYNIARGSFDPVGLCANAGPGCSVIENQIALAEDMAINRVHGGAVIAIRYQPYPECEPWTSTNWIEFTGLAGTASEPESFGPVVSEMELDFEMFADETCQHHTRQFEDTGVWEAKPLGSDRLRGEMRFPEAEGVNAVDFTLDVTWQTEAPEGFFGEDGTSDTQAFFFFFDELVPGE